MPTERLHLQFLSESFFNNYPEVLQMAAPCQGTVPFKTFAQSALACGCCHLRNLESHAQLHGATFPGADGHSVRWFDADRGTASMAQQVGAIQRSHLALDTRPALRRPTRPAPVHTRRRGIAGVPHRPATRV